MDSAFFGTELKFIIEINADGFSMADDDFNITLKRGAFTKVFQKGDLVQDEEDKFYLCFDSAEFGKGMISAIITAYVPDDDFDDGLRTEVQKIDLIRIDSV